MERLGSFLRRSTRTESTSRTSGNAGAAAKSSREIVTKISQVTSLSEAVKLVCDQGKLISTWSVDEQVGLLDALCKLRVAFKHTQSPLELDGIIKIQVANLVARPGIHEVPAAQLFLNSLQYADFVTDSEALKSKPAPVEMRTPVQAGLNREAVFCFLCSLGEPETSGAPSVLRGQLASVTAVAIGYNLDFKGLQQKIVKLEAYLRENQEVLGKIEASGDMTQKDKIFEIIVALREKLSVHVNGRLASIVPAEQLGRFSGMSTQEYVDAVSLGKDLPALIGFHGSLNQFLSENRAVLENLDYQRPGGRGLATQSSRIERIVALLLEKINVMKPA